METAFPFQREDLSRPLSVSRLSSLVALPVRGGRAGLEHLPRLWPAQENPAEPGRGSPKNTTK